MCTCMRRWRERRGSSLSSWQSSIHFHAVTCLFFSTVSSSMHLNVHVERQGEKQLDAESPITPPFHVPSRFNQINSYKIQLDPLRYFIGSESITHTDEWKRSTVSVCVHGQRKCTSRVRPCVQPIGAVSVCTALSVCVGLGALHVCHFSSIFLKTLTRCQSDRLGLWNTATATLS